MKGKGNFRCYAALDFSGKFSSWGKCPTSVKNGQKTCFFHFLKNFISTFNWKRSGMKDENVFRFLMQSLYLVKFLFLSYSPKMLSVNQFAGDSKLKYLKNYMKIKLIFCMSLYNHWTTKRLCNFGLWPKVLSANLIVGFFKLNYL